MKPQMLYDPFTLMNLKINIFEFNLLYIFNNFLHNSLLNLLIVISFN